MGTKVNKEEHKGVKFVQIRYFSCAEIAEMTGMPLRAIWRRIKSGEIKASRPGGRDYIISEADLNEFINRYNSDKESAGSCLKCSDISEMIGVKKRTIYGWIRSGKLKASRPRGRDYLVTRDDLSAFMASDNRSRASRVSE